MALGAQPGVLCNSHSPVPLLKTKRFPFVHITCLFDVCALIERYGQRKGQSFRRCFKETKCALRCQRRLSEPIGANRQGEKPAVSSTKCESTCNLQNGRSGARCALSHRAGVPAPQGSRPYISHTKDATPPSLILSLAASGHATGVTIRLMCYLFPERTHIGKAWCCSGSTTVPFGESADTVRTSKYPNWNPCAH